MVAMLQTTPRHSGLTQIQPLLGADDNVWLPASSVDLAVMVDAQDERNAGRARSRRARAGVGSHTVGTSPWQHLVVFRKRN